MDRGDLSAIRSLSLRPAQMESMRFHVQACLPLEACGLLAGEGNTVKEIISIRNQAASPTRFRMDPEEQLRAFEHMESEGMDLLGIYHSHPEGPDRPSPTDIAEAAYQSVYVIWWRAQGNWSVRGWWIEDGRLSDVKLEIAADE